MRRHLCLAVALTAIALLGAETSHASWVFRPSYFTHDPETGQRVAQFSPGETPYARGDATYQRSGYRHMRSSLRGANGSADRMHIVETWGAGEYIRPYGEWQRPFRAGATPYGPWGNPQGPWTSPFGSWMNPYGLGRFFQPPPFYGDPYPGMHSWPDYGRDRVYPYPLPPGGTEDYPRGGQRSRGRQFPGDGHARGHGMEESD
jgi:hypothetical protein